MAVPNSWMPRLLPRAKETNTAIMTAAAVMTRPVLARPSRTGGARVAAVLPLFVDA
jgi:hypothetical protein